MRKVFIENLPRKRERGREGIDSLIKKSEEMFGEVFHKDSIQRVCNGKRKTYKGYTFKYIK